MIGIADEGLAIPLFWQLLNKAGNATANEHIGILQRFVRKLGKHCILGVLGDREFASGKLFHWLIKSKIPFYIRIKDNTLIRIRKHKLCTAKKLFNDLHFKEQKCFGMAIWLFDEKIYLMGSRSERGELMIVATNIACKNAIAIYLRRWEIENLFQSLKSRGFQFETTHLSQPERIEKLLVLLAIGFCWCHKIGEWHAQKKPIIFNKHRSSRRPQYSYFRYGLDFIRDILLHMTHKTAQFRQCLKHLILPIPHPPGGIYDFLSPTEFFLNF